MIKKRKRPQPEGAEHESKGRRRKMPTFRFNSERPYYRDGRLVKKVRTDHQIRVGALDCAVLGWTGLRLVTKLTLALIFKRTPYRLL